jgi:hypothetical protein
LDEEREEGRGEMEEEERREKREERKNKRPYRWAILAMPPALM